MPRINTSLAFLAIFAPALCAQSGLLVSGYGSQSIHRYDELSGAPLGVVASAPGAQSLRYGPDGCLYACAEEQDRVLKLDGSTGAFLANFVSDDPATTGVDESGGLDAPTAAVFGPDGNLYVASFSQNRVLRYDGATGQYLGIFVAAGSGTLSGPDAGMTFGPDGNLYVPSFNNNRVLRYDGKTGAFLDAFVSQAEGVSRPRMLRFRSDGKLYVTSWGNNKVARFDLNGVLIDNFVPSVTRPTGLVFDPANGDLLITSDQTSDVKRFDGATGASKGTFIPANSGGLTGGTYLEFLPDREYTFERLSPGTAGVTNSIDLHGATPNSTSYLLYGFGPQALKAGPCGYAWLGVQIVGLLPIPMDAEGAFHVDVALPVELAGSKLYLQAFDLPTCRVTNLVIQTF